MEAGDEEQFVMDVPLLANMLQFTDANWKYKTMPSKNYCLGNYIYTNVEHDKTSKAFTQMLCT